MYHLRPYSADIYVEPAKIMYHLPSYHQLAATSSTSKGFSSQNGAIENNFTKEESLKKPYGQELSSLEIQAIETHRESSEDGELFDRLMALSSRLDTFITRQTTKKENPKEKTKHKKDEKITVTEKSGTTNKLNKQPKNAKSESNFQTSKSPAKEEIVKPCVSSPDVVHASVQPTSHDVFPIHDYGDKVRKQFMGQQLELFVHDSDRPLIELLKPIGVSRNIIFLEALSEKSAEQAVTIVLLNFKRECTPRIMHESKELSNGDSPVSVWNFLGSLLGLYSAEDQAVSALSDKWLALSSITETEQLSRQLSSHLGAWDFLSSTHAVCLADLILRSRFIDSENGQLLRWKDVKASNNVQLWIKRVDEALSHL